MIFNGIHFVTLSETSDAYDEPYILVENTKYCGGEEHLFWDDDGYPMTYSLSDVQMNLHRDFCKNRKLMFLSYDDMRYLEELIEANKEKKGEQRNV